MKKLLLVSLTCLAGLQSSLAQYQVTPVFNHEDKIIIQKDESGSFYHNHYVRKGQTVYGLSKAYGISSQELLNANGKSESTLSVGEPIKIPVNKMSISSNITTGGHAVKVVYRTQPKDNLFRLSKVYFDQSIESIKSRNNIVGNGLAVNQEIIVGYLTPGKVSATPPTSTYTHTVDKQKEEAIPTVQTTTTSTVTNVSPATGPRVQTVSTTEITTVPEVIDNKSIDELLKDTPPQDFNVMLLGSATYDEKMTLVDKKEVAFWDKHIHDNGKIYALHNTAAIDSYIELYNPLVKRSVKAKVVGRIPFGAYTDDVQLIISPRAAQALGALDERLRVEVQYYKI